MANGNAIVIKSLSADLNVIMYARTTSSSSDYLINTYILTDNLFHKVQIKANIFEGSLKTSNSPTTSPENKEIHFITSHYEKVYNNSDFKFSVKVFDKSIYSGNNFDNFKGKLNGVKVSATIIDPNGKIKTNLSGITENGIFDGVVYVPENLWPPGWYTVNLEIENVAKNQSGN